MEGRRKKKSKPHLKPPSSVQPGEVCQDDVIKDCEEYLFFMSVIRCSPWRPHIVCVCDRYERRGREMLM